MTLDANQVIDVDTFAAVIAHSQIVVPAILAQPVRVRLPAGFEAADIAILDWIAAQGLRAGHSFVRM